MNSEPIRLTNASFSYGQEAVLDNFSYVFPGGEISIIMGASGCGKSTLLKLISGIETLASGVVILSSNQGRSDLRMLFQDYDAFPWFTVWQNMKHSGPPASKPSNNAIETMLRAVGLWESRGKYPIQLSGGMRKRRSLARALVNRPSILLMDEPFAKLDVDTKIELYGLLQNLWLEYRPTVLLVTHDVHEAVLLGHNVIVSSGPPLLFETRVIIELPYPRTDDIVQRPEYGTLTAKIRRNLSESFHPLKSGS